MVSEGNFKREELIGMVMKAGREHSTAVVLFHSAVSEKVGLGVTDYKTLDLIMRLGPATPGEIARYTGLTSGSVTSLIDRMEKKGFVLRERDPKDRRRVIVHIRCELEENYLPLFDSFGRSLANLLAGYTNEQLEIISDFMARCAEIAFEESVKLRSITR